MRSIAPTVAYALAAAASALAGQEQSSGPIVELPRFVVTDSRELPPPESWRYATVPGFEILTNASDKATQRLLRDFDMFRQALGHVWPIPDRLSHRGSLIICGRGNKFDAFIPEGRVATDAGLASLFLKQGQQSAIVIDLQATTLNVLNTDNSLDAATGTDSGLILVEHDKQLYREYVRYLLSPNEPRLGAWLEEGLSQIIMRMQFDRRWIQFAKLEDPNTVSASGAMIAGMNALAAADDPDSPAFAGAPAEDRDFNAALRRRALIPLGRFFAVQHDSPEATNVLGNNRWAKQAYAFVHMCLYGYKGKYQKAFTAFMLRSAREPVTEQMFKECFRFPGRNGAVKEMSFADMLLEIRSYCDFTVYDHKEFRSKVDVIIPPPPPVLRDATQSEIGRIKGEALALAGHAKAARAELIAPYQRGERDPDLLAALGLHEQKAGADERARRFLEAAFAGKSKRPDAAIALARLRYADALAAPGTPDGRFSDLQVAGIIAPLQSVRREPPPQAALYDLAADTFARSATQPTRDDATMVIEGAQFFPKRLKLAFQGAVMASAIGDVQAAHALADHGIRLAPDANVRKRFEELKATFPPAPRQAAPAGAAPAKGEIK